MATMRTIPNKNCSTTLLVRWEKPRVGDGVERNRGERRFVIPAGASKKVAAAVEREATEFKWEIERGGGVEAWEAGRITVAELARRFLEAKARRVKPATLRSYRGTIEGHVLPALGHRRVSEVRAYDVQRWLLQAQAKPVEDGTVRTWWTHLTMLFGQAVRWEFIGRSPCDGVDAPPAGRGRERVLTAHEEAAFVRAIVGDPYEALWRVMLYGGLRVGEALALRWCDVDLDAGVVTVCRTVTKAADGGLEIREGTKNGTVRRVAVNGRVVAAFRARRGVTAPRFAAETCFGRAGNWMRPAAAGKRLAVIRRRAGLPDDVTCHVFRHSHISQLRDRGKSYKAIALRVGHKSLGQTWNYDHPGADEDRDLAESVG